MACQPTPSARRTIERIGAFASTVEASTPTRPPLTRPCAHEPEHQDEHGIVELERQPGPGARQRAVVGHRLARPELQETAE